MKVLGMLESAQFENIVGNPSNTPTGRFFADVTAPLAALPKFYDGSKWQTLGYVANNAWVSQNSGTACTVDWSTGLNQIVVLTGHAVISFVNPQEGQVHTLQVQQARFSVSVVAFMYVFNMPDQDVGRVDPWNNNYQPKPIPSRSAKLHQWTYHSGAVAAYTTVPTNWQNTGNPPSDTPTAIDIRQDGKWLGVATSTTPFSHAYELFDFVDMLAQPFGAAYAASTATAAALLDAVYSPNGQYWSAVSGTSPFLQTYITVNGINNGGVFSNPGTLPTGAAKCVEWNPFSNHVAVGTGTTPFIQCYPVTSGAYGTVLANPGTLPTGQVNGIQWSPHGDYIALALNVSPFISCYNFIINSVTGVGTFGSKVNDPGTLPAAGSTGTNHHQIAWRPQADFIAMCMSSTPWVYVIPFSRASATFGTPITFPALSGGSTATSVTWTPDGQYLIVGASSTPYCYVYDFSTGVPILTTLDFTAPATGSLGMSMHPSGLWGAWATSSAPKLSTFIPPNKQRNYVRIV